MISKITQTLFIFLISISAINAETYQFTQSGFAEGATVTLSFTGQDLNNDTQITSGSEITDFNMSFSGNSVVPAFNLAFADLYGLVYDTDGGPLGDGLLLGIEGVGAVGSTYSYIAGPGPFAECGVGVDCASVSDGANTDFSQELLLRVLSAPVLVPSLSFWSLITLILLMIMFSIQNNHWFESKQKNT